MTAIRSSTATNTVTSPGLAWGQHTGGGGVAVHPVEPANHEPATHEPATHEPIEAPHDPSLLREVLDALEDFDPARLDPVTVFHLHLTDTTLEAGAGVVRVEDIGPTVLSTVRDWLTHPMCPDQIRQQVRVRPVLDADAVHPVDAYEWPTAISDLATVRNPYEVFPYGTRTSRDCEDDHVIPFRPGRRGQTRIDNNAKLSKRHHRIKTFGGWALHHPEPGLYLWRTRHGHWLRVDAAGTHHLGRDPALDARYHPRAVPA